MKTNQAVQNFLDYHRTNSKNTLHNCSYILGYCQVKFGEREIESITPDEILDFLTELAVNSKQTTKRLRYSNLKSLFNQIQSTFLPGLNDPCNSPTLKKVFRFKVAKHWPMIEKDIIDEIIFRTENPRNRLMMELMACGGLRIGEVLKLELVVSSLLIGGLYRTCEIICFHKVL